MQSVLSILFDVLLGVILSTGWLYAGTITIGNNGDYAKLSDAEAFINAGDTVLVFSQVFSDGTQFLHNLRGTANAPIVILSQSQHGAIFRGGTEAIHLINCTHIEINGLVIEQQTGNGINIDDGGDYSSPAKHINLRHCLFRDMAANGNNDLLKMSGVDSFLIEHCRFVNGAAGGSGIDFVGCHWGTVQDCYFDEAGVTGIQNKGGTQYIRIQRNIFKNMAQRALNLGGKTGLQFFRPPLPDPIVDAFEAADIEVFSNVFIGSWSPIAYVGSIRVKVYHNTFFQPENWVIRILQETTEPGFVSCGQNEFRNNIVYLTNDLTEVNIGPDTDPASFTFSHNLWFNENAGNWTPTLPVMDVGQLITDPQFLDATTENFRIPPGSPAVGAGLKLSNPISDFDKKLFADPPSTGAFEGSETSSQNQTQPASFFNIFPNPAQQLLQVGSEKSREATIRLWDTQGRLATRLRAVMLPTRIDLRNFSAGLYYLEITNTEHTERYLKKIMITR